MKRQATHILMMTMISLAGLGAQAGVKYVMNVNPHFPIKQNCTGDNGEKIESRVVLQMGGDNSQAVVPLQINVKVCAGFAGVQERNNSFAAFPAHQIFSTAVGSDRTINLTAADHKALQTLMGSDVQANVLIQHTTAQEGDVFTLKTLADDGSTAGSLKIVLATSRSAAWPISSFSGTFSGVNLSAHTVQISNN